MDRQATGGQPNPRRKEPTVEDLLAQIRAARDEGKPELSFRTDSEEVVREICTLTSLQDLRPSLGELKQLPAEIGQLTELTCLNLENTKPKSLPDELFVFHLHVPHLEERQLKCPDGHPQHRGPHPLVRHLRQPALLLANRGGHLR